MIRLLPWRRLMERFARNQRGNVAVIFAFSLVPLLALTGAAVDYTRANAARTAMQSALDSAALMVSKDAAASSMTADQITARAQQYFQSLYTNADASFTSFSALYTPNTGQGAGITLTAEGILQTDFLRVLGTKFDTLPVGTSSTSTWGSDRMRIALVLDNTGSMADNGKMAALQKAATDTITQLSNFNQSTGDVYISLVPFAKDVRVDKSTYVSATWINWKEWEGEPPFLNPTDTTKATNYPNNLASWAGITTRGAWYDQTGPGSTCPFDSSSSTRNSNYGFMCVTAAQGTNSLSRNTIASNGFICPSSDNGAKLSGKSGIIYNGCYTSVQVTLTARGSTASCSGKSGCTCSGSGSSKQCSLTAYRHDWRNVPAESNPTPPASSSNSSAAPAHSTWTGCINDRDQTFDVTDDAPNGGTTAPSNLYYAEQWTSCTQLDQTIVGMSNDWASLKTDISNMAPGGNTNQAVGLAWGWQTLNTSNGPFEAPAKAGNWQYKDFVVLLSDGLNTQNRWTQTASDIDARQELLCSNVKAAGITVFTIQVNINNADPKSQVLQDCASKDAANNPQFQMITTSSQTSGAFQNVVDQITKLHLAK